MTIAEIQARTTAPRAIQMAFAIRDRDALLQFVDEITAAFDENQEKAGKAVEKVLIKWEVICPF